MSTINRLHGAIIGLGAWVCCAQFFVVEQIAAHAWKYPYRFAVNYISDLGAVRNSCSGPVPLPQELICSPLHTLMNASFVLQGLLIFTGTLMTRRLFPFRRLSVVGRWFLSLAALGVVIVGLAPEDMYSRLHFVGAALHLLFGNLGICLLGTTLLRSKTRAWRYFGAVISTVGVFGVVTTLILPSGHSLGLGPGLLERVSAYPIPLALIAMGVAFLPILTARDVTRLPLAR